MGLNALKSGVTPSKNWCLAMESISSSNRGGKMSFMRLAIILLPHPGFPSIKKLCIPAAAMREALLAMDCPFTSKKSLSYFRSK